MDHASDGKKKLDLTRAEKKDVVHRDLGRKAIEAMDAEDFLQAICSLTNEEIAVETGGNNFNDM